MSVRRVLSSSLLLRQSRRWFSSIEPHRPSAAPQLHEAKRLTNASNSSKASSGFQFTLFQVGVAVACGTGILGMVKLSDIAVQKRKRSKEAVIVSEERIGKPKLGGPWTLYDSASGKPLTSTDLKGKFQLIYFGFTYCPDICPEEMEKQKAVVDAVEKRLGKSVVVQPVFITVDPQRDTLAQTASYVKEFSPKLIGLTGTPEMIKKVTRLFRVYYNEGIRTRTEKNGTEDYLVDHSIIHYLIGPNNEFIDFYGKNLTTEEMTDKVIAEIKSANRATDVVA
jgi:cytochrome oxidase Cu insertion factor (SCO1/SenC/PrrC family)